MEEYQVIIVGSGPAGSACAKALHDEGIEALVIEKEGLPRHKVCSGILFGQTQVLLKEYFGTLPPKEVYCEPEIIHASDVEEWNREKGFFRYVWEIPKDGQAFPQNYHNVWRNKFDYWLLKKSGVEYRDRCAFKKHAIHNNKIEVTLSQKGEGTRTVYCSYLVGAGGVNCSLRKAFTPSGGEQGKEVVVYQTYYRFSDMGNLKDAHWNVFFEPSIGDMLSCVHRKDDFLTLCVGGFKGRNLKKSIETFKDFLTENFHVVLNEMERDEGCIERLSMPYLGKGKVLLTGDAAGLIYLNGEGISAALDSGYRAGKAIAQGIQKGGDVVESYTERSEDIINHTRTCMEQLHFLTI